MYSYMKVFGSLLSSVGWLMSLGDVELHLGWSLSINIKLRVFPLPLSSCSLTTFSPPTFTASWFSVSISHPPLSALLYLSAFLPASFCLSLRGTQTRVYLLEFLISCLGCVSNPLFLCPAHIKHLCCFKWKKETERRICRKHINERMMAKVDVKGRGVRVCGENQDDHDSGRESPDWWHRHRENQRKNEKGVENTKQLIIMTSRDTAK